jgi:hypothetical protein
MRTLTALTVSVFGLLAACSNNENRPSSRPPRSSGGAAITGPARCAEGEVLVSSSVLSGVAPSDAPTVTNECMGEEAYRQRATASMYVCQRDAGAATCLALPPSAGR